MKSGSNPKVLEIVRSYLEAKSMLQELVPEFNWSNLLGDFGEYLAIHELDLKQAPTGTKGYDAINAKNKTVQIKAVRAGTRSIKFKRGADYLLVVQVNQDASWEQIYYGNFEKVFKYSHPTQNNGEYTIGVGSIRKIAKNTYLPKEDIVLRTPNGREIRANTRREMIKKLKEKGFKVPGEPTVNRRINDLSWEPERAFGLKVPPNYAEVEHFVNDKGYSWFPDTPTVDMDRKPLIYHPEKRIYISQNYFCEEKGIPKDYLSDKLKEDWDPSRIIETYNLNNND